MQYQALFKQILRHKHCCLTLSIAFRHFHISYRIEQRSRLLQKIEPDGIKNRLYKCMGGSGLSYCWRGASCGQGSGAVLRPPVGPRQSHGGDPEGEGSLIVGDPSVHDSHRFSPSRKPWFATMRKLMDSRELGKNEVFKVELLLYFFSSL